MFGYPCIQMNLLDLIALTLTSVMVFYYLRVCVVVIPFNKNVHCYSSSVIFQRLLLPYQRICITNIYVCGGESVWISYTTVYGVYTYDIIGILRNYHHFKQNTAFFCSPWALILEKLFITMQKLCVNVFLHLKEQHWTAKSSHGVAIKNFHMVNPISLPSPLYHVIQFRYKYLIFQLAGECYIEEDYSFCAIHTIMQILLRCTLKSPWQRNASEYSSRLQ